MKKIVTIVFTALVATACTHSDQLNLLITNAAPHDTTGVTVTVPMSQITPSLAGAKASDIFILNEKNAVVKSWVTPAGDAISFTVPIIYQNSQKNYTISTVPPERVSHNIFRFRNSTQVTIE